MTGTDLEQLLSSAQSYNGDGISMLDSARHEDNWSFGQSVLFTVTVVTTVGMPFFINNRSYYIYIHLIIDIKSSSLIYLNKSIFLIQGPKK